MERKASVVWEGQLKSGRGKITTDSGILSNVEYSFGTRFESKEGRGGTNPEELIAAAHAACFSMALSAELEKLGLKPERIRTSGSVRIEKVDNNWSVTSVQLDADALVPGAQQDAFDQAAENAKKGCPISRLLNAPIALKTKLETRSIEEKRAG